MEYEQIKKIINDMSESSLNSLNIEFPDGVKINITKDNNVVEKVVTTKQLEEKTIKEVVSDNNDTSNVVKSPMVGTCYLKPSPEAKEFVKVGDTVTPNTVVGKVGSTGSCTTGPHLHFEMTKGARYVTAGLYGVPKSQCFSSGVSKWRIDPTTIVNLPGYWQRFDGR